MTVAEELKTGFWAKIKIRHRTQMSGFIRMVEAGDRYMIEIMIPTETGARHHFISPTSDFELVKCSEDEARRMVKP